MLESGAKHRQAFRVHAFSNHPGPCKRDRVADPFMVPNRRLQPPAGGRSPFVAPRECRGRPVDPHRSRGRLSAVQLPRPDERAAGFRGRSREGRCASAMRAKCSSVTARLGRASSAGSSTASTTRSCPRSRSPTGARKSDRVLAPLLPHPGRLHRPRRTATSARCRRRVSPERRIGTTDRTEHEDFLEAALQGHRREDLRQARGSQSRPPDRPHRSRPRRQARALEIPRQPRGRLLPLRRRRALRAGLSRQRLRRRAAQGRPRTQGRFRRGDRRR